MRCLTEVQETRSSIEQSRSINSVTTLVSTAVFQGHHGNLLTVTMALKTSIDDWPPFHKGPHFVTSLFRRNAN